MKTQPTAEIDFIACGALKSPPKQMSMSLEPVFKKELKEGTPELASFLKDLAATCDAIGMGRVMIDGKEITTHNGFNEVLT